MKISGTYMFNFNLFLLIDNFEVALKKLKKAEDYTDITTDVDKEKKSRKNRRKKKYSSSSSEELNPTKVSIKPLPQPPAASNKNLNKPSTSKFHIATDQASTPSSVHNKPKTWSSLYISSEESMSSDRSIISSDELDITDENLENSKNHLQNVNNGHEYGSHGKNSINYNLTVYNI